MLQDKLNNYYDNELRKSREIFDKIQQQNQVAYESSCKAYRKATPVRILLILLSIAALMYFAASPSLLQRLQEAVHSLFTWLEECLANAMREDMAASSSGIGAALLDLLLGFLSLIAGLLLLLFKLLSWPLALLICLGIPGLIIFFAMRGLIRKPRFSPSPAFDEQTRRAELMNSTLPSEQQIIKAGLEGEAEALNLLSTLGNDCHIYTNLIIPYDGSESETDIIVVAPHAVTIVEVKNYQDELIGDWSDEKLILEAERGSTVHRKDVYNPVRQVATHAYRLSGYLREHSTACRVNTCVLFVNSNVHTYQMQDANSALSSCPVFLRYQLQSLLDYLQMTCKGVSGKNVVAVLNELAAGQANRRPHDPSMIDPPSTPHLYHLII